MSDASQSMVIVGETDASIFELNLRLRRIPERLAEARRQLEAEELLLNEVLEPWTQLEREIQERDTTIKIALDTIGKFEVHMKKVTTQKEYLAARKQVDEARRLNTRLQDEILERRVVQEELNPRLEERRGTHRKVLESYQVEEGAILKEQAQLEQEIAALAKRVEEHLQIIGSNAHPYYQRLMKSGKQPAVVPVVGGSCQGCNMALPPQTYNQLLASSGKLFTCPACARIIYTQAPDTNVQAGAAAG